MPLRVSRRLLPVATATALAGVLAFHLVSIRRARSGCTGDLVAVPVYVPSNASLVVKSQTYIGPESHPPLGHLFDMGDGAGLLGDIEIHTRSLKHPSHSDMIIGHHVQYLRAQNSCSGSKLIPPFHGHYEPPYHLLFDRSKDLYLVASASSTDPPLLAFRRLTRLPPTAAVKAARAGGAVLLVLAALSWLAGIWLLLRTSRPAGMVFAAAGILAAAAIPATALGWDTRYLAHEEARELAVRRGESERQP